MRSTNVLSHGRGHPITMLPGTPKKKAIKPTRLMVLARTRKFGPDGLFSYTVVYHIFPGLWGFFRPLPHRDRRRLTVIEIDAVPTCPLDGVHRPIGPGEQLHTRII